MECSTIIYICSVSLQITGALILIVKCLSTKRKNVVKRFFVNSFSSYSPDSNTLDYTHELFEDEYEKAYYNKISFVSLLMGYILAPFSNLGDLSKVYIALLILMLTLILLLIFIFICKLLCRKGHSKVTIQELQEIGIKVNMCEVSEKEIDEMISKLNDKEV